MPFLLTNTISIKLLNHCRFSCMLMVTNQIIKCVKCYLLENILDMIILVNNIYILVYTLDIQLLTFTLQCWWQSRCFNIFRRMISLFHFHFPPVLADIKIFYALFSWESWCWLIYTIYCQKYWVAPSNEQV